MIAPLFYLSIAFFMAILLAQAGIHKVVERRTFLASLRGHGVVPQVLEKPMTYFLAGTELLLALAWILAPQVLWVGVATAILLLGYATVLSFSYFTGRIYAGCGCEWGDRTLPIRWWMPVRNVVIALIALSTIAPDYDVAPTTFEYMNAVGFSISAALIYFALSELSSVRLQAMLSNEVDHG